MFLSTEEARECYNESKTDSDLCGRNISHRAFSLCPVLGASVGDYDVIPIRDAIKYGLDLRVGYTWCWRPDPVKARR